MNEWEKILKWQADLDKIKPLTDYLLKMSIQWCIERRPLDNRIISLKMSDWKEAYKQKIKRWCGFDIIWEK